MVNSLDLNQKLDSIIIIIIIAATTIKFLNYFDLIVSPIGYFKLQYDQIVLQMMADPVERCSH